jgi:hypothetical protein
LNNLSFDPRKRGSPLSDFNCFYVKGQNFKPPRPPSTPPFGTPLSLPVPDRRRRTGPEVVYSEALGNWGSGNLEGEGVGEKGGTGEVSSQATWDRGGRILSQLGGFQVSKKGLKGEQRGTKQSQQGEIKARGSAMYNCAL